MSKNIVIQEGGTAKQMTVSKLKTDKVGGGTCLWVPEEEVSLATKSISANGTYKASDDGKYGFSQVTVNVPEGSGCADSSGNPISSGGEPTIGSSVIGIDPSDGETYQYSVDSQGGVTKTPVLDVDPSGAGSSVIGTDPNDGKTYEYSVDSQGGVTKTLVPTITPGGPGSGVVGTDPEDGNEYFIGIDSGGNIVKTKIPSGIDIGKEPNKTTYTSGESIDYSGIIVTLKGGDSAVFSNARYANGRIPFSELSFPVQTAHADGGGGGDITGGIDVSPVVYPIPYSTGHASCMYSASGVWDYRGNAVYAGYNSGGTGSSFNGNLIVASGSSGVYTDMYRVENGKETFMTRNRLSGTYTYDGKTVYYTTPNWSSSPIQPQNMNNNAALNNVPVGKVAWALIYGQGSGGGSKQTIPVKWTSPYDGRTFEDTFEITVTGGSSGTTGDTGSGSGYSDDSGGSSSGGGTSF